MKTEDIKTFLMMVGGVLTGHFLYDCGKSAVISYVEQKREEKAKAAEREKKLDEVLSLLKKYWEMRKDGNYSCNVS